MVLALYGAMAQSALYIGLPVASVIAAPFLGYAFEMYKESKSRTLTGSIFWAIAPFGVTTIFWAGSGEAPLKAAVATGAIVFALIGGAAGAWGAYVLVGSSEPAQAQDTKKESPGMPFERYAQNITSNNQSGGITAGTVNIGPQPRSLDSHPELKSQILNSLPRDKPITVMAVAGDADSMRFAQQIWEFLGKSGFELADKKGISQGFFSGPVQGLQVRDDGAGRTFIVGPP